MSKNNLTDCFYKEKFFGPKKALLMNVVPIIPEVIVLLITPIWLLCWAFRSVKKITKHIDKVWKEIDERERNNY